MNLTKKRIKLKFYSLKLVLIHFQDFKQQNCTELIYINIYKLNCDLLVDFDSLIFGEFAKYHEFEKKTIKTEFLHVIAWPDNFLRF